MELLGCTIETQAGGWYAFTTAIVILKALAWWHWYKDRQKNQTIKALVADRDKWLDRYVDSLKQMNSGLEDTINEYRQKQEEGERSGGAGGGDHP
jgi:hypothetical protein